MTRTLTLAVVALSAALSAQTRPLVSAHLTTADAVGVRADRVQDAARAGTAITTALHLQAANNRDAYAHSVARLVLPNPPRQIGTGADFVVGGLATAGHSAATLGGSPLADGAQDYKLELAARSGAHGKIIVTFHGDATDGAAAGATVALRGGQIAFRADGQRHMHEFPRIALDANPLAIRVMIKGGANGGHAGAKYNAALSIRFVSDSAGAVCTVSGHQRSCPEGGVLAGTVASARLHGAVRLDLTGAQPNAIGVTIVSGNPRTFPFTHSGCIFFADPIVHGIFSTDGHGDATSRLDFPLRSGATFYVHQATLLVTPRGASLATSNSLQVSCR